MIPVPTSKAASRRFGAARAQNRNGASRRRGVRQFAYDENGSMLREYDQAAGTTTYYAYADNGLASRMKPGAASATYFHYDARMQRFAIDFAGTLAYFGWDGLNQLEERQSDLSLETQHTHGATPIAGIGSMVVTKHVYTPDRFEYPHYDHRGSLFFLEDTVFGYLDTEFNAFGEELYRFGDASTRFGYQGTAWMRLDSGLYVSPTRLYVPGQGRFGQRDPRRRGVGLGLYAYVEGRVGIATDPDGLDIIIILSQDISSEDIELVKKEGEKVVRVRRSWQQYVRSYNAHLEQVIEEVKNHRLKVFAVNGKKVSQAEALAEMGKMRARTVVLSGKTVDQALASLKTTVAGASADDYVIFVTHSSGVITTERNEDGSLNVDTSDQWVALLKSGDRYYDEFGIPMPKFVSELAALKVEKRGKPVVVAYRATEFVLNGCFVSEKDAQNLANNLKAPVVYSPAGQQQVVPGVEAYVRGEKGKKDDPQYVDVVIRRMHQQTSFEKKKPTGKEERKQ